ncbi:hypothetical protein B7P43_G05971 [Cryptotermes secundus]|uniref:D-isomer specific 2-hydroxyacid dehydrogenase NAD-binding domain-containing protein n=1 Tax=Cryptotermes secundus TaxID=105785 RepID=A0A2J7RJU4_9NEOP|nr:glyoxylate reductase/hydroxypyruvate reductase isoform X2 [Cryptotermes secundus]PNF41114.1 hypothetical protein B7P43_G05971 [Cryptotermes secundus]
MGKLRVLVTNSGLQQVAIEMLKERYDVDVCPELPFPSRQQILQRISGSDAVLWFSKEKVDSEMLDKAGPNLKVLATMSAGYDHIDVKELKKRGIKFGNTPNVLNAAVAEVAVLLCLATARRLHEGRITIENNTWVPHQLKNLIGQDIQGSTVGIVGFGGIGQAIAKRLIPFEVGQIIYSGHSPKLQAKEYGAEFVPFDQLLRQSDFVIVACPLTEETREMFDEEAFNKMKPNAVLVNVARGGKALTLWSCVLNTKMWLPNYILPVILYKRL